MTMAMWLREDVVLNLIRESTRARNHQSPVSELSVLLAWVKTRDGVWHGVNPVEAPWKAQKKVHKKKARKP